MEPRPDHQFDPYSVDSEQYARFHVHRVNHNDAGALFEAIAAGNFEGLGLPKLISPNEVRQRTKSFSTSIFKDFETIKSILDRHEATIQKRWKKKTQEQRRKVILSAWGENMSKTHRPDFEAFRIESEAPETSGTQYRDAFMWPYINEEDLTKPRPLLHFLKSRGRHGPATFAAADSKAMHLGLAFQAIEPLFLHNHVMLFRGATGPETYGKLLHWNEHPDAFSWMRTRKEQQPGEGLLILEVQARIMSFLVRCAMEILPDIAKHDLLHAQIQLEPPHMTETEVDIASLAVMMAESPYQVPSQLDLGRLESLLAAKCDDAADHLWALREDPGYFNFRVREAREHRKEVIKDEKGQAHPIFRKGREDILWGRILNDEVTTSYVQFEMWHELHDQCVKLKAMQTQYRLRINLREELPEDYLEALLTFQYWLHQSAKGPLGSLKKAVVASPPWRMYHEREPVSNPAATTTRTRQIVGLEMSKTQLILLWLLHTLWEDGKDLFYVGITTVVDELQYLIESSREAREMITSYVASIIADLSVSTGCLYQLGLYQPWAVTFEKAMPDFRDKIMKGFVDRTKTWALISKALDGGAEKVLATHGSPAQVDFRYPIEKRRTKDNVSAIRKAEANLDKFWNAVDEVMHEKVGDMQNTAIRSLLTERKLQRTPEWMAPSQSEVNKGVVTIVEISRPLSELYIDLEQRTERTISKENAALSSKIKQKTRGGPSPFTLTACQPTTEPIISDSQPTFQVDARALKVFKTLFFTPSLNATPGEIPWTDFLHAMISTGFRIEKLYGSVWQFNPTELDNERSIHFHEPHPSNKIPYLIARRHGRRLNRAYGWHGAMFELAKKGGSVQE